MRFLSLEHMSIDSARSKHRYMLQTMETKYLVEFKRLRSPLTWELVTPISRAMASSTRLVT